MGAISVGRLGSPISALRNQVGAQAGKGIDATTVTRLNALTADLLVLL